MFAEDLKKFIVQETMRAQTLPRRHLKIAIVDTRPGPQTAQHPERTRLKGARMGGLKPRNIHKTACASRA